MNIIFLIIFYKYKYSYYLWKEKKTVKDKHLNLKDKFVVYVLNSFIINDEVYLVNLNFLIGVFVIFVPNFFTLFILQLFTIIKFIPTIKQILIAFKTRLNQLLNMVGFLAILIYFYANISFFYFSEEFVKETDIGTTENLCQSMLQCSITFFNLGVRNGGGIGDLLDMRSYEDNLYAKRYLLDLIFYITVILLLLNMINGVIVTAFSQLREERDLKDNDKKNKCYICSLERELFEKSQLNFEDHVELEHNYLTYIQYLVILKFFNEKDMDADQNYVIANVKKKEISCFPQEKALCIENSKK